MNLLITFYRVTEKVTAIDETLAMLHHTGINNPKMELMEPVVIKLECSPRNIDKGGIAERVKNVLTARYKNMSDLRVTFEDGQTI